MSIANKRDTNEFVPQLARYRTGSSPGSLAIGDLNGDGKPDLVVVNTCGVGVCDTWHSNVGVLRVFKQVCCQTLAIPFDLITRVVESSKHSLIQKGDPR